MMSWFGPVVLYLMNQKLCIYVRVQHCVKRHLPMVRNTLPWYHFTVVTIQFFSLLSMLLLKLRTNTSTLIYWLPPPPRFLFKDHLTCSVSNLNEWSIFYPWYLLMCLRREGKLSCGLTQEPILLENVPPLFLLAFLNFTLLPPPTLFLSPPHLSLREASSGLEKWGAALVFFFFAGLCNRKHCVSGTPSADWWDADGKWKSSPVALGPCSDVIAATGMKSALTKCTHWWMDKAGNWMWE